MLVTHYGGKSSSWISFFSLRRFAVMGRNYNIRRFRSHYIRAWKGHNIRPCSFDLLSDVAVTWWKSGLPYDPRCCYLGVFWFQLFCRRFVLVCNVDIQYVKRRRTSLLYRYGIVCYPKLWWTLICLRRKALNVIGGGELTEWPIRWSEWWIAGSLVMPSLFKL